MMKNNEIKLSFNKNELSALANVVLYANPNLFNSEMNVLQFVTTKGILVGFYKKIQLKRSQQIKSNVHSLKLNIHEMWAFENIFGGASNDYSCYEAIILDNILSEIHKFQINIKSKIH